MAHRLRGDEWNETKSNIYAAIRIGRWVISQGHLPLVPHVFALIFDDGNPLQRDQGMSLGAEMLLSADELWVFGHISPGVAHEVGLALEKNIPIHYYQTDGDIWTRREVREISVMRHGKITCTLCKNEMDLPASYFCQRHGRVCPGCWSHEYKGCQVCADREYAEETRYGQA